MLLILYYFLATILVGNEVKSESAPPVNCSCKCFWWTADPIAQAEGDQFSSRITNLLTAAVAAGRRHECAIQLNQRDIASIIDGRSWQLAPTTTPRRPNNRMPTNFDTFDMDPGQPQTNRRPSNNDDNNYQGSDTIAISTAVLHPEAVDSFVQVATNTFASFSNYHLTTTRVLGGGGPASERVRLNATEQRRLAMALLYLFRQQQSLLMPLVNETITNRKKRQASFCNPVEQTEACRLLELVKAGTLFLLPTIPDVNVNSQQSAESSAFANVLDMCGGRQAKTLTRNGVCIDANVLKSIGTMSINYYGETSVPLTVKSLVGGIFPMLSSGGSPSFLHRYGVAVDIACGMFEPDVVPDACLKILTMCHKKARQINLPSLHMSVFAENFGCGSSSSYFDSVHCTLGAASMPEP